MGLQWVEKPRCTLGVSEQLWLHVFCIHPLTAKYWLVLGAPIVLPQVAASVFTQFHNLKLNFSASLAAGSKLIELPPNVSRVHFCHMFMLTQFSASLFNGSTFSVTTEGMSGLFCSAWPVEESGSIHYTLVPGILLYVYLRWVSIDLRLSFCILRCIHSVQCNFLYLL